MSWISFLVIYRLMIPMLGSDINNRDFHLFTKKVCKNGCSRIACYPNTLLSIDSIERLLSSDVTTCNPNDSSESSSEYNCHFKFIKNHIYKTCSNMYSCEVCPDKIEMKIFEPNTLCTSEFDFKINYRCIPGFIKNDNVCAHSYLDLSCFDRLEEKLVILNATIVSKIRATSEDSVGCPYSNVDQSSSQVECQELDKTNLAISKCSFRDKCSIGPNGFTPNHCGNMHMKISHACVPSAALYYFNKKKKERDQIISLQSSETKDDSGSWLTKQKWKILGISSSIMVVLSVLISLACFVVRKKRDKHNCHVNGPKDNLFNKLGQVNFSPPPSSIDKVNIDFDTELLSSPDSYHCNSENDDINIRSIYSSKLPSTISYNSPFCIPPAPINTCQYFTPMISPGHINMLEMPPIQQASSGNLTSSTNSSHGTPRGTKSSGIFSMNEASFEISHQV